MKRKGKLIGLGIVVVIVLAMILVLHHLFTTSATGTVSTPHTLKAKAPATTLVAVQGKYADFTYPSYFTPVKADTPVLPVLVDYNFIKQQLGSWQIAIQISNLPTGNLNDDSSYHYRKAFSQQYSFSQQTINGQIVPIATDKTNGAFNEVAFLKHGTLDASLSLQGGNGQDDSQMQAVMTAMLTSWQWH